MSLNLFLILNFLLRNRHKFTESFSDFLKDIDLDKAEETPKEEVISFEVLQHQVKECGFEIKCSIDDLYSYLLKFFPSLKIGIVHVEDVIFYNGEFKTDHYPKVAPIKNWEDVLTLGKKSKEKLDEEGEATEIDVYCFGDKIFFFEGKNKLDDFRKFQRLNTSHPEENSVYQGFFFFDFSENKIRESLAETIRNWEKGDFLSSDQKFIKTGKKFLPAINQRAKLVKFLSKEYKQNNNQLVFEIGKDLEEVHKIAGMFYFELHKYLIIKDIYYDETASELRMIVTYQPKIENLSIENLEQKKDDPNRYPWGDNWLLVWDETNPRIEVDGETIRPKKNKLRKGYLKILKALLTAPANFLSIQSIREIMGTGDFEDTKNTRIHSAISNLRKHAKADFIKSVPKAGYELEKT